jgi:hypothetical protein
VVDLFSTGTPFNDGFDDLRNDLSCTLYKNPVPNTQVFALDISLVMKGSARDGNASNVYRFEQGPGVN